MVDGEQSTGMQDDGELLGPLVSGSFSIGYVDEVNGAGAERVEGYPITRAELLVLVRHWYREDLGNDLFCFHYGCSGSREIRIGLYAQRRIARIEALVGTDAVQEMIDKVREEERARLGEETWRIFTEGDETERARIQDDVEQSHVILDAKRADDVTCRAAFAFLAEHPTEVYIDSAGDLWHLAESRSSTPGQLVLMVRTKSSGSAYAVDSHLPRPPGWRAPYGLR